MLPLLFSLARGYPAQPGQAVSGTSGEFFRYRHVYAQPPSEEDRASSIGWSLDVQCEVCREITLSVLSRVRSTTEDDVLDLLEGPLDDRAQPVEGDPQATRVVMNKRGCNKLYKDDLMVHGWRLKKCDELGSRFCLVKSVSRDAPSPTLFL
jgi:hypothetical protein